MTFRVRTKDVTASSSTVHEEWYRFGTLAWEGDVSVQSTGTFNGMVDREIEHFHTLKKKGQLFFNPMCREKYSYSGTPVGIKASAWLGYRHDFGTLVPRSGPAGLSPLIVADPDISFYNVQTFLNDYGASIPDSAVTKAWSNMDQTTLELLATLGEGKETLATIAKTLRRLISFYKYLHSGKPSLLTYALKGDKKAISSVNKAIKGFSPSSEYMEIRYALRPLMYELGSALDLLSVQIGKKLGRITSRGFSETVDTSTAEEILYYDAYTGIKYSTSTSVIRRCRAGVLFGLLQGSSWLDVLGLKHPVGAVWELTKLSFAIDWIINIGDLIASWEQNSSVTVHGSWYRDEILVRKTWNATGTYCTWEPFGYTNIECSTDPSSWTSERWVLFRQTSPPRPLTPSIRIKLDWLKILDLAVILKQLVVARR